MTGVKFVSNKEFINKPNNKRPNKSCRVFVLILSWVSSFSPSLDLHRVALW
ncbi:hypothetical protein [Moraxella lacunata]|uniref:hypothetical protein n=1 Tax=Moraxella lacunata TaxID=477 RepID=UPI003EE35FCC